MEGETFIFSATARFMAALAVNVLLALLVTSKVAETRGRSASLWFVFGVLNFVVATVVLYLLPDKSLPRAARPRTTSAAGTR